MKKYYLVSLFLLLGLMESCNIKPEKINFGSDACQFCKMTIVDQQHASQYVTNKGKQFKFDAIECMLNDLERKEINEIFLILVSDYGNPGEMVEAKAGTFLVSQEIKSPMGAFLSAFSSEALAIETQKESDGELYTWLTIKEKYSVK